MNASSTGTSKEVLQYYARNWSKIANCYALDDGGLPVDPAWYRRRLYQDFLARTRPRSVLDVGCGGGWTVLDALQLGIDARGIEPVAELVEFGHGLLKEQGHDPARITQDDLAICATMPPQSQDCVALLSVLPHVPRECWDDVHANFARLLRPGGRFVAAYRNQLFDLFTFNSLTVQFYDNTLWESPACAPLRAEEPLRLLKGLITNPDVPGPYFTAAQDKSFGKLDRMKSNPLTMSKYLERFGFTVERTRYYHFHCVPPILGTSIADFRQINHGLEMSASDDWRGNFMAAIFMVECVRE